jgi:threonine dehydrogenase-like Zn-dependent dehydrogenase
MKAWQLTGPKTFQQIDIPEPSPEDGEVKIKIETSSVCGSDIILEWRPELREEDYPLHPGAPNHEVAGTVVESRNDAIKAGQRVIVIPREVAGLVEYTIQTRDRIIPVPDWGPLDEWVMCQHSGTVLYSAKQWGNAAGKRIAVLGQGGIGLSFTMIAEKQGAAQVIGLDLLDYRCQKSLQLGATHTINPSNEDIFESLEEITEGNGVDVVVDASGNPDGLETAIRMVKQKGLVIGFSLVTDKQTISHRNWMTKEVTLIPTVIATTSQPVQEIREIVALKARGWIDPGLLKTHNMSWDEIPEAYQAYADHADNSIKIAVSAPG